MELFENLPKQIIESNIDIDSLNELIQYEENGKKFSINKNGEIICEQTDFPWYKKIVNYLKIILKFIGFNNEDENIKNKIVGIINIGNNCYLNAGLQILSRCFPLLFELLNYNYKNNYKQDKLMNLLFETMLSLLLKKDKYYNPSKFIECFCKRNKEFIQGQQNCSQDFIRTILRNINDIFEKNIIYKNYNPYDKEEFNAYQKYILENQIFPMSKPYSIFSGILKIHISGICPNCGTKINDYSFSHFVDQILYLDSFSSKCKFSEVLEKNIGKQNKVTMKCSNCNEKIQCKSVSKFVKIPEIFIFTLERFLVRNKVPVEADEYINIYDLVDELSDIKEKNCKYELFAINIRLGKDISFGHEICHIKQKQNWYTIDDGDFYPKQREFNEYSYGLFYRRNHLNN